MTQKNVKHILGTGEEQDFVRLYADDGKALTNDGGETVWNCIDVLPDTVSGWSEIPYDPEDATEEDYQNALVQMGVEFNENT